MVKSLSDVGVMKQLVITHKYACEQKQMMHMRMQGREGRVRGEELA